jgi:hypothetical protein
MEAVDAATIDTCKNSGSVCVGIQILSATLLTRGRHPNVMLISETETQMAEIWQRLDRRAWHATFVDNRTGYFQCRRGG